MAEVTADEILADAAEVDPAKMAAFLKLIPDLIAARNEFEEKSIAYAAAQTKLNRLMQIDIPAAMRDAKTRAWTLDDGQVLSLQDVISGSIPKDDAGRAAAFAWLQTNGHEGIIKHFLSIELGKGSDNVAKAIAETVAKEFGVEVIDKTDVHYQTLQAFIKELFYKSQEDPAIVFPPDEVFNIYRGQVANLGQAKKPKIKTSKKK